MRNRAGAVVCGRCCRGRTHGAPIVPPQNRRNGSHRLQRPTACGVRPAADATRKGRDKHAAPTAQKYASRGAAALALAVAAERHWCAVLVLVFFLCVLFGGVCFVVSCSCFGLFGFLAGSFCAACRVVFAVSFVAGVAAVVRCLVVAAAWSLSWLCAAVVWLPFCGLRSGLSVLAGWAVGLFVVGVFALRVLRVWGSGAVVVRFGFLVGSGRRAVPSVVECRCHSRSAAARLLWRFRAARRWALSFWRWFPSSCLWLAPAGGGLFPPVPLPRFGLRWLAWRRLWVVFPPSRGRLFRRVVLPPAPRGASLWVSSRRVGVSRPFGR